MSSFIRSMKIQVNKRSRRFLTCMFCSSDGKVGTFLGFTQRSILRYSLRRNCHWNQDSIPENIQCSVSCFCNPYNCQCIWHRLSWHHHRIQSGMTVSIGIRAKNNCWCTMYKICSIPSKFSMVMSISGISSFISQQTGYQDIAKHSCHTKPRQLPMLS